MSWRVALAVIAVALVSVIFGLDWKTPSPPPQTVDNRPVAFPPPPPEPPAPVRSESVGASTDAMTPPPPDANQARAQAPRPAAPAGCNVAACEAHYKSFRAADCTYQPNNGPRRLCRRK
jgi:hypothetical protein